MTDAVLVVDRDAPVLRAVGDGTHQRRAFRRQSPSCLRPVREGRLVGMEVHGPPEPGGWLRKIHATIDEKVRVRLSFDYDAGFPVEVMVPAMGWGFVSADMLGITEALGTDLSTHQQWWQDHVDFEGVHVEGTAAEWRRWRRDVKTLADRLQAELDPECEVDRS